MNALEITRSTFEAIGTKWDVQIWGAVSGTTWTQLQHDIHARIESFDIAYSRFRDDSLVTQISKVAGTYKLPADGYALLRFYEELYRVSDGRVTPLIGQTVADAGYDAAYSFTRKTLAETPRWEEVLFYDETSLTVTYPVLLDFGAAGKGYLIDMVGQLLEAKGIKNYLINAGGDMLQRSSQQAGIDVGLENPLDVSEAIGITKLLNQSLCASAGSKRKWGEFHHIIDPETQRSPRDILATWVVADDTMTADGLATALFFTSPADLRKQFSFSYAILESDMSLHHSKDFPIETFETEA